jgi:hypothetical protein
LIEDYNRWVSQKVVALWGRNIVILNIPKKRKVAKEEVKAEEWEEVGDNISLGNN